LLERIRPERVPVTKAGRHDHRQGRGVFMRSMAVSRSQR
jgi:hypothetical protein